MNYIMFLDESGDHGLSNIDEGFPTFVLCGVIMGLETYYEMKRKFEELKKEFWGNSKVILHSRDIRKCQKEFSVLLDTKLKAKFYDRLNKIISETNFRIIASAIDKKSFVKRYGKSADNPYNISLSFIIERAVFLLDELVVKDKNLHLIIEKRGDKEDKNLYTHFSRIYSNGTYYVNNSRIHNYGFKIDFRNKLEDINGLQLADLVAYPIARHVIDKDRANPAFDMISDKFYTKFGRRYGLKVFP